MIRRLKTLAVALVAVFAVAAATAATASALELPENLPVSAVTRTWVGESEGELELSSETAEPGVLLIWRCTTMASEGTEEPGKPLGLFHWHLSGCVSSVGGLKVKCTDLNHSLAGEVLILGTWHLVFDRIKSESFTELTTGVLFLIELAHIGCGGELVEIKGEVLCLHLKPTEKALTHSFHCVRNGDLPTEEWCMKDKAGECFEPLTPKLEANVSHTAFRSGAIQLLANTTYKNEIFADI